MNEYHTKLTNYSFTSFLNLLSTFLSKIKISYFLSKAVILKSAWLLKLTSLVSLLSADLQSLRFDSHIFFHGHICFQGVDALIPITTHTSKVKATSRGVVRNLSNLYDEAFCENSSVLDVWLDPEYASTLNWISILCRSRCWGSYGMIN